VKRLTGYYLDSGDFNGYRVRQLEDDFAIPWEQGLEILQGLIKLGRVSIVTSHAENPCIK